MIIANNKHIVQTNTVERERDREGGGEKERLGRKSGVCTPTGRSCRGRHTCCHSGVPGLLFFPTPTPTEERCADQWGGLWVSLYLDGTLLYWTHPTGPHYLGVGD